MAFKENNIEKELKEVIIEIANSLKENGRKEAVVKWQYPELPGYFIELVITNDAQNLS